MSTSTLNKRVFLQLGSSLGDREKYLQNARSAIADRVGQIEHISKIYATVPWGHIAKNEFLNQVLVVQTKLDPFEILEIIQDVEVKNDRNRLLEERWADRTLDIDILFIENLIVQTQKLIIPHPKIAERLFVLLPLQEIAPDFIHPILKKSMYDLYHDLNV